MRKKKSPVTEEKSKPKTTPSPKRKAILLKKNRGTLLTERNAGNKRPVKANTVSPGEQIQDPGDWSARIASRAHELFQHRGGHHGQDLADWFEAERQVLQAGERQN